jgi:ATP-binding cassette subfamily B protein
LKHSALDQLMDTLPQGDNTMVGERGIKLSGGQRQRLGIARALVREADLIIFDEATASLDSLSEQVIQNALGTVFASKTMVIIAHRLSTVRFADRIIVLEDGRIAEQGRFADLIARNGKFAAMWALQSSGFIDDDPVIEIAASA